MLYYHLTKRKKKRKKKRLRYSDEELEEFRKLILEKLDKAQQEYEAWKKIEELKFIWHLKAALIRIKNKFYGICRATRKLIPKERLLAVPHATLCIEELRMKNEKL